MSISPSRGPDAAQYNPFTKVLVDEDGPLPWADDEAEPLTAEDIARTTDAVNFVLVAAATPDGRRAYLDALIGASLGAMDWFEAADIEIGQRARQVSTIGLKDKTVEKWVQREREEFSEWQTARGITLVEAMPGGKQDGVNHKSKYRLGNLFRLAIETDKRARAKPGFDKNPKRELRKAAAAVYLEFRAGRQEPAKRNRFKKPRQTCDTFLKLIDTYLNKLAGQALIEHKNLPQMLEAIELTAYRMRVKCAGSAPLPNRVQVQQAQEDNSGGWVDGFVHSKNGAEMGADGGFVHTLSDKESGQTEPVTPAPLLGQDVEDFCRDTFPTELDVDGPADWRLMPVTVKQRELLQRGNVVDFPATRGEASDRIGELLQSGALSDFFSLEDLNRYDSKGGRGPGKEKRWCCPACGDDKPQDDEHRSLSLNTSTGEYFCHRCGAAGVLQENLDASRSGRVHIHTGPQQPEQKSEKWRKWWSDAKPVAGTPGAKYLESRGVPIERATAAGVRYGIWWRKGPNGKPESFNAVLFPVYDAGGNLVAVIARSIAGKIMRTAGNLGQGVFLATPDALNSARVAIVEAPIDALVLRAVGLDAIALGGTAIAEWLPAQLEGKDIAVATDADKAGDECAADLALALFDRATVWRLRPAGVKDWAELAEASGLEAVDEAVMDATERGAEL